MIIAFSCQNGLPVKPKIALAFLAVMPFSDLVNLGNGTVAVTSV